MENVLGLRGGSDQPRLVHDIAPGLVGDFGWGTSWRWRERGPGANAVIVGRDQVSAAQRTNDLVMLILRNDDELILIAFDHFVHGGVEAFVRSDEWGALHEIGRNKRIVDRFGGQYVAQIEVFDDADEMTIVVGDRKHIVVSLVE